MDAGWDQGPWTRPAHGRHPRGHGCRRVFAWMRRRRERRGAPGARCLPARSTVRHGGQARTGSRAECGPETLPRARAARSDRSRSEWSWSERSRSACRAGAQRTASSVTGRAVLRGWRAPCPAEVAAADPAPDNRRDRSRTPARGVTAALRVLARWMRCAERRPVQARRRSERRRSERRRRAWSTGRAQGQGRRSAEARLAALPRPARRPCPAPPAVCAEHGRADGTEHGRAQAQSGGLCRARPVLRERCGRHPSTRSTPVSARAASRSASRGGWRRARWRRHSASDSCRRSTEVGTVRYLRTVPLRRGAGSAAPLTKDGNPVSSIQLAAEGHTPAPGTARCDCTPGACRSTSIASRRRSRSTTSLRLGTA